MQGLSIKVRLPSKTVGMYITPSNCTEQLAQLIVSQKLSLQQASYIKNTIIKDVRILHSQYLNQLKKSQQFRYYSYKDLVQQKEESDEQYQFPSHKSINLNKNSSKKMQYQTNNKCSSMNLKSVQEFDITNYKIKSNESKLSKKMDSSVKDYHPKHHSKLVLLKDLRMKTEQSLPKFKISNTEVFDRLYYIKKPYQNLESQNQEQNTHLKPVKSKYKFSKSKKSKPFDFQTTKRAQKSTTFCEAEKYKTKKQKEQQQLQKSVKKKENLIRKRIKQKSSQKKQSSQSRCKVYNCQFWNKINGKQKQSILKSESKHKSSKKIKFVPPQIKPVKKQHALNQHLGLFYQKYPKQKHKTK